MAKVAMAQIAKELNVSRALGSYALSDKYGVSEEMKRRIITTAVEMGYFRDKPMNVQNNRNISVVIGEEYLGTESFFVCFVAGIESGVRGRHCNLNLIPVSEGGSMEDLISRIINSNTHGLIVIRQLEPEFAQLLNEINIPKVFVDLISPNCNFFEVRVNNFGNMFSLVWHVLGRGHRHLVFCGDISWATSFEERYNGFVSAVKTIPCRADAITSPDPKKEVPYDREALKRYLRENPSCCVVCASDSVAAYAYQDISELGLKIPDQISVVGFDDVEQAKRLEPSLTTMHIPKFEMGRVAFQLLYEQFAVRSKVSRMVCLNAHLIERHSLTDLRGSKKNGG